MSLKKSFAKALLILLIGASVAMPIAAFAAQSTNGGNATFSAPSLWPTGFWGPIVWCSGSFNPSPVNGKTPPTCTNLCDLVETIINVIYLALSIAIFIIAPISFVVGGIMIMIAGANPEMLGSGKRVLQGAVIGLVIVLCSYLIVNTVLWALNVTAIGGFNGNPGTCQVSG